MPKTVGPILQRVVPICCVEIVTLANSTVKVGCTESYQLQMQNLSVTVTQDGISAINQYRETLDIKCLVLAWVNFGCVTIYQKSS